MWWDRVAAKTGTCPWEMSSTFVILSHGRHPALCMEMPSLMYALPPGPSQTLPIQWSGPGSWDRGWLPQPISIQHNRRPKVLSPIPVGGTDCVGHSLREPWNTGASWLSLRSSGRQGSEGVESDGGTTLLKGLLVPKPTANSSKSVATPPWLLAVSLLAS